MNHGDVEKRRSQQVEKGRSRAVFPMVLLCASVLAWFNLESAQGADLAVLRQAPDFSLTTQDGETLKLADLRGKVVLVGFIFTTCSGTCPATTARMNTVAGELRRGGLLKKDQVRLVSITLDPKRDTPKALRNYRELYDIEGNHWAFLTGPAADVNKVLAAWGMWAKPAKDGQLDHPSRVFLLDQKGRVREIYSLAFFKTAWVMEDIRSLLKEGR